MPVKSILCTRTVLGTLISLLASIQSPAAPGAMRWSEAVLRQKPEWYGSAEARAAADSVLRYQSREGAWPKNTDLLAPATADALAGIEKGGKANTIDNNGTTLPMAFLARVAQATGEAKYRDSFLRGVDYLLAAQYPNGGWPQFWPLRPGYYSHITYNDGAMIHAMTVLRDVAGGKPPYDFVDPPRRARAGDAVARGIGCILKTQIRQDGKPTAWCAQHDERTLEPAWARKYEPPSLSGCESVSIVRFLMSVEKPTPEIIAAIEGAVAWFQAVAIKGERLETIRRERGRPDRRLVDDPDAPQLWARFYELGTNRPLYLDRDSVFRYDFAEVGYERRSGYDYNGNWPTSLLATEHPAWRQKQKLHQP
jgi:PelA/Pel-15E family pectate lyase